MSAMATTSLKLPDDLKERVRHAAQARGMSPHAFLLESVRLATIASEQRTDFISQAQSAREHAITNNEAYDAREVHAYARARARGQAAPAPKAGNWRG